MAITYEWDIETVDGESGDILDHSHRDRLHEFGGEELTQAINQDYDEKNQFTRLVLVRDDGLSRSWAYVTLDGKLPEKFLDAYDITVAKVPKRFIEEFNR